MSGSLSMAAQASPDLLHGPHRSPKDAAVLSAKIDALSALTQFIARPMWVGFVVVVAKWREKEKTYMLNFIACDADGDRPWIRLEGTQF